MPPNTPKAAQVSGPALPEIAASDLEAVRRFLTSSRHEDRRGRLRADPGGPAVGLGIARARVRSAAKPGA
jgi:hypothetical protein